MHYLDNAATTMVLPQVIKKVSDVLRDNFANPSSLYALGQGSSDIMEAARQMVATALGCNAGEVFFTASGTEGNNIAVFGAARARQNWGKHIVLTGYEHPAVHVAVQQLVKNEGFEAEVILPDGNGEVDPAKIINAVTQKTVLVAAMHANNEVGSVLDIASLAAMVKEKNKRTFFHSDGVQAFLKMPFSLKNTAIDSYAVSGHKIQAPKGVGALFLKGGKAAHILPLLAGGGQERGFRPGTENIAFIAGLASSVESMHKNLETNMAATARLNALLLDGLAKVVGISFNSPKNALKNIVNISLAGIQSETMLHHLESFDVYVSSGSACSKAAPSHTLSAMGLAKSRIDCALRISFGTHNTKEDVDAFLVALQSGIALGLIGLR